MVRNLSRTLTALIYFSCLALTNFLIYALFVKLFGFSTEEARNVQPLLHSQGILIQMGKEGISKLNSSSKLK